MTRVWWDLVGSRWRPIGGGCGPVAGACCWSFSASSTARPHRSFVAVHSAPYRHNASADGGSHSAGSWSDFDRFDLAVTATREAGWPWSFA